MLKLENVSAAYGRSQVLFGVDLDIADGEAVTLIGRNGVGKTTLLRTICGLQPVTSGQTSLDGETITRTPAFGRARAGLAYVPQGRGIFSNLTVRENLLMGLPALTGRAREADGEIPTMVYDLFPILHDMAGRKGGNLSGGQQQQLAIARALVMHPRLLVLDEPTEGIQPSIIKDIGRVIALLRSRGTMAILLVEQYYDFARELADTLAVMDRGDIVLSGAPATLDEGAVRRRLSV